MVAFGLAGAFAAGFTSSFGSADIRVERLGASASAPEGAALRGGMVSVRFEKIGVVGLRIFAQFYPKIVAILSKTVTSLSQCYSG